MIMSVFVIQGNNTDEFQPKDIISSVLCWDRRSTDCKAPDLGRKSASKASRNCSALLMNKFAGRLYLIGFLYFRLNRAYTTYNLLVSSEAVSMYCGEDQYSFNPDHRSYSSLLMSHAQIESS